MGPKKITSFLDFFDDDVDGNDDGDYDVYDDDGDYYHENADVDHVDAEEDVGDDDDDDEEDHDDNDYVDVAYDDDSHCWGRL